MTSTILVILIATVFFVIVPGVGAFTVRHNWRTFRRRVTEASLLPPLDRREPASSLPSQDNRRHFLGALEGIQDDHIIWIHGSDSTLAVDMNRSDVFVLPYDNSGSPDAQLVRTSWRRAGTLIEGTKVLVAGAVDPAGTHPMMHATQDDRVLVVFYEGPEKSLVRRSIWNGRQLNEYWNQLTPASLVAGMFALVTVAYMLLRQPMGGALAVFAMAIAAIPVMPLLPPGIGMFLLYRSWWRRGRLLRAHRDIVRLPSRYLRPGELCGTLPGGEEYCRRSVGAWRANEYQERGVPVVHAPVQIESVSFEVYGRPGVAELEEPHAPLAELIAIAGEPEQVSRQCQQTARRFEFVSIVALALGIAMNLVGAIALMRLVFR
jgi:hypothetical protein